MRRGSRVFATGLFMLGAMGAVLCSVVGCRSAVKDFYDPLLVPPCEGGAGGQGTSQGGSSSQSASSGMGGSAGAGGECTPR